MKKIFTTLLTTALLVGTTYAQTTISFEESEGYSVGDLNTQGLWSVTGAGEGAFVVGQEVTAEMASDGTQSLHITADERFGVQSSAIVGAFYNAEEVIPSGSGTISMDYYYEGPNTGNYIIGLVNMVDLTYVTYLQIGEDGELYIIAGQYLQAIATMPVQEWVNIKIEFNGINSNVYLNDEMIGTTDYISNNGFNQVRFTNDNTPGASAYIDNFRINDENMAVTEIAAASNVKVYPNPVKDVLNIQMDNLDKLNTVEVYSALGQKMHVNLEEGKLNFSKLPAGVYIVNVKTEDGVQSHKVVKK